MDNVSEGNVVRTPYGTGSVVKRIGMRVRVQHNDGKLSWVEVKDISAASALEKTDQTGEAAVVAPDIGGSQTHTREDVHQQLEQQGGLPDGFMRMDILERQAAMAEPAATAGPPISYAKLKRYLPEAGVPAGLVASASSRDYLLDLATSHQVDLSALRAEAAVEGVARQAAEAQRAQEAAEALAQQNEAKKQRQTEEEERARALFAVYSPALLQQYVSENLEALCRDRIFHSFGSTSADGHHLRLSEDGAFELIGMERGMVYDAQPLSRDEALAQGFSTLRTALEAYPSTNGGDMLDVGRVGTIAQALVEAGRSQSEGLLPEARGYPPEGGGAQADTATC